MNRKQQRKAMAALRRAIRAAGGPSALAAACGVRYNNVWNWLHRDEKVPPEHAPAIDEATGIPKTDLCPDFPWPDA